MKAIILADRNDPGLTPDEAQSCTALLPIGSKPLVCHTLDALAAAGFRRATLAVREHDLDSVRRALSEGCQALEIEYYAHAFESDQPDAILRALEPTLDEDVLVIRGDVLRSACVADFLARAQAFPGAYALSATIGGVPAGLRLLRAGASHPVGLARDPQTDWHEGPPRIELPSAVLALLTSAAAYHGALLEALAGRFVGLDLGGRCVSAGVSVGRGVRLHADSVHETPVHVGRGAKVQHGAQLLGSVLIGAGARVEAGARLRATVVLPGSVVPAGVELENALVSGAQALLLDTGTVVDLSALRPPASPSAGLTERVLAWVALLLALPLWPLALLAERVSLRRDADAQAADALHWLASLSRVRELQPRVWRLTHIASAHLPRH